jgi:hypothetical protein
MKRYLEGAQDGVDTTIARPPEQLANINFDHNNIVIHGKGFATISALESVIGRDAFRRIYGRCLAEFGGRRLGVHTLQAICEEETGEDLEWFFSQWVRLNRYLAYRIASVERMQDDSHHIARVRIERLGTLEMPIPVEARFEDGSVQRCATDRILAVSEVTFESESPLREVVLDPEEVLALLETPPKPTEQEVGREISEMRWTGVKEKARELFARARECELSVAGLWAKLGLALYDGAYYAEALEAFHRTAEWSEEVTWRVVGWVWQGHTARQ